MTHSVLIARLTAAGLDPALFSPADLTRISRAMRDLPPVPALPEIVVPTLPYDELQPLLDEIDNAAQSILDILHANTWLSAFVPAQTAEALRKATSAVGNAIPDWMHQAESVCIIAEADCDRALGALDEGSTTLHQLACLHAAAQISSAPDAEEYCQAITVLEASMHAADAAMHDVTSALDALDKLFNARLPNLLEAVLPLFEADASGFSPAACRRAALALREAAHF